MSGPVFWIESGTWHLIAVSNIMEMFEAMLDWYLITREIFHDSPLSPVRVKAKYMDVRLSCPVFMLILYKAYSKGPFIFIIRGGE